MFKSVFAMIVGLFFGSTGVGAQPYNMTIAGFSPGGLVSALGVGMDSALAAAYPGSAVTYQTSSGGLANAMLVSQGKVPFGLISDHEVPIAWFGRPPFKAEIKTLRLLFRPIVGESRFLLSHVVVTKAWALENGVKTFADLRNKPARIAINRPGNIDGDVSLAMLKEIGVTPSGLIKSGGQLIRAASSEMKSLMLDRRIDLFILGISYNHPNITEIASGVDIIMLPITENVTRLVSEEWNTAKCMVGKNEYKFLEADTYNPCIGIGVYASDAMSDDLAYLLTKAMFNNIDKIRASHRALADAVNPKTMALPGLVPFHPGAEKYLRETGILK